KMRRGARVSLRQAASVAGIQEFFEIKSIPLQPEAIESRGALARDRLGVTRITNSSQCLWRLADVLTATVSTALRGKQMCRTARVLRANHAPRRPKTFRWPRISG